MSGKPYLTIKQFAARWGVSRQTIHNWLKAGTCPVEPIPNSKPPKFLASAVDALLNGDQ